MVNRILIIALDTHWAGISRLPYGLNRAGFSVFALCPKKSFIAHTRYLEDSILYPTFTYSRAKFIYLWILFAIFYFKPQFIIPGDEDAVVALQNLANLLEKIPYLNKIAKLIRNSLPPKSFDSVVLNKAEFQKACLTIGVRVPKNKDIYSLDDALIEATQMGYPIVLKKDAGYGGGGVFICQNEKDLRTHLDFALHTSFISKIKNSIRDLFFISIFTGKKNISLQQYIEGRVGLAPFCAKDGNLYAQNPMLKFKTHPGKTGPTSVALGFFNSRINQYVEIVVKNFQYTGFGSLDFIVDDKEDVYVIELNPRPVPTCHFGKNIVANDLCETLYKGLNSRPIDLKAYRPFTVALFPNEKKRDPNSPYLTDVYHDIPVDDPDLVRVLESF